MSIDVLHEKIRKLKNPSVIDLSMNAQCIPPQILESSQSELEAYTAYCHQLLKALKGCVPAVRFSFGDLALMNGLDQLSALVKEAEGFGYYVLLDAPDCRSVWSAERCAGTIFGGEDFPCDALIVSPYIGSDAIKPFVPYCKAGKDLFVVLRSPNKSAPDLQDLLSGSRQVHVATADLTNRAGESIPAKCGYSHICGAVSAGSASSIRNIRAGYKGMYLLVDGVDHPSGNFKNCAGAFDCFGYGAVVCAGASVTAAWRDNEEADPAVCALAAAERMKKNLLRYVTVL